MNIIQTDCTLRDGGYYTGWDFDEDIVRDYFKLIDELPIEYLEIGYLNKPKDTYFGEFYYLPDHTLLEISNLTSKKLAFMIDSKDCKVSDLQNLVPRVKDYVSMIRLATDPARIQHSLDLAREIAKYGVKVALNIMYISKVNADHEIFDSLGDIGGYVDILNLVDSYGSVYPNDIPQIVENFRKVTTVTLGFHGHNNIELAYANCLAALSVGITHIDTTVLGMGRGAGNLKTEMLLAYRKSKLDQVVDLNVVGKLVDVFSGLHAQHKWGSNLAYMVSGNYTLPQKDVMEALEINRYSLAGIVSSLDLEAKLSLPVFKRDNKIKNCLILGGGQSVVDHLKGIKSFLSQNKDCIVVHSSSKYTNTFKGIANEQIFAVAGDELLNLGETSSSSKYVLEPSPRKVNCSISNLDGFYELSEVSFIDRYHDSPLTISLQITSDLGSAEIYLAGFDGYSETSSRKQLYIMKENQDIIDEFGPKGLLSLTPTNYKNLQKISIYGLLMR